MGWSCRSATAGALEAEVHRDAIHRSFRHGGLLCLVRIVSDGDAAVLANLLKALRSVLQHPAQDGRDSPFSVCLRGRTEHGVDVRSGCAACRIDRNRIRINDQMTLGRGNINLPRLGLISLVFSVRTRFLNFWPHIALLYVTAT